jgi:membrane protease YdiL (CAAX protease family)
VDFIIGALLFAPIFMGTAALDDALQSIGFSGPVNPEPSFLQVHGLGEALVGLVLVVVVALSEETIFRGYLILRLRSFTAGVAPAIILSSVIFSLGHGYEGASGMVTVGTMGAVLAIIYVWRKSLVAPMVIHFLQDFVSIVFAPLFFSK